MTTGLDFIDGVGQHRSEQTDVVSNLYIRSVGAADPTTGNRAQVASPSDNETITTSTYGLLVRTVGKLKNLLGTGFDTVVNAGVDLISPRGVQAVSAMLGKEILATSTTSVVSSVSSIALNVANTTGFVTGAPINLEPGTVNYESAMIGVVVANTSISITFPTGGALFSHTQPFTVQTFQENMPRQAPGGTGVALVSQDGTKAGYRYSINGISPVATPTDFILIKGSASATVRVRRIRVGGKANTGGQLSCLLIKRSAGPTVGGATLNAVTAAKLDSGDGNATAVVDYVSVANLTPGASAGQFAARRLYLNVAATGPTTEAAFEFGQFAKASILRGTSEYLCINFNGDTLPSGAAIDAEIETEEDQS